ncbi:C39 family peptidase [Neobacillus sp. SAB-20_R2A]|uniref:C39 family peptidase n=1 Tax=Neobacillus sp. SAB-20_R2A TaxID=3120519 RepID=UPI003C6E6C20
MKLKIFAVIFILGILASVSYAEAQKDDFPSNTIENTTETKATNEEEQKISGLTETSSVESQENEVQAATEPHQETQTQQETQIQHATQTQQEIQPQNGKIIINNVPHIQQMPELARGCEVTSLAMLLQYAGVAVDKMTLAKQIKTIPFRDQNGLKGNPNDGFVGDIYSFKNSGYGVYHGPIVDLAEIYLPGRIIDLTGQNIDSVYNMLIKGSPVWVITNSRFASLPQSEFSTWDTASGKVQITYREHSVLLVGYDENYVYLNDPLAEQGNKTIPRDSFEESWIQMGKQAISFQS